MSWYRKEGSSELIDPSKDWQRDTGAFVVTLDATPGFVLNGDIRRAGESPITERGFVFGTESLSQPGNVPPSDSGYTNFLSESGNFGLGVYSLPVELIGGFVYYFRAWIRNDDGFIYGVERSVFAPQPPPPPLSIPISGHCVNGNRATIVHGTTIPAYGWVEYWQKDTPENVLTSKPSAKILAETKEQWELGELLNVEHTDALRLTKEETGLVQKIEVFTESGTFNVPESVDKVDVLVVAGGGGGAGGGFNTASGGGGAGGLVFEESFSVNGDVTVVVGNGGEGSSGGSSANDGENGQDSQFGSITAIGGGGGGNHRDTQSGNDGGSGGGGASGQSGGSGTAGQGNDGGDSTSLDNAGGGGGAGQVGENATASKSGDGGDGLDFSEIFGTEVGDDGWFAGGGGGASRNTPTPGVGGEGGGGDGGYENSTVGQNAMANTGGGGGGSAFEENGGNGGSGVVIVRYVGTSEDIPDGEPILGEYHNEGNRVYTRNFVQPRVLSDDLIEVELEKEEPAGTSVVAEISLDGGETWIEVEHAQSYGEFGQEFNSIMTRVTLSTEDDQVTPSVSKFNVKVGYFLSTSLTQFHSRLVENLSPGTTYEYHLYAISPDGQEADKEGCELITGEEVIFAPRIMRPVLTVEKVDTVKEIEVVAGLAHGIAQKLEQEMLQLNMPGYDIETEVVAIVKEIEKSHKLKLSIDTEIV